MYSITCPCGIKVSFTAKSKLGRKKYCSKKCFYQYHGRRSGLKYKVVKENPTWFKKGFKPWNVGIPRTEELKKLLSEQRKGKHYSPRTEFTSAGVKGSKNFKWKGDEVGYFASHGWIQRNYGKASKCENREASILDFGCTRRSKSFDWAFIHKAGYARDRDQYIQLCHSCHIKYDRK